MAHETDSDIPELGSFEWYRNLEDKFFVYLTKSMVHSDNENRIKIMKIFPHIAFAQKSSNWNKIGDIKIFPITINIERSDANHNDNPPMYMLPIAGSINNYLKYSGDFVKSLTITVLYADDHNRELIRQQYPQLIAAFYMDDHYMCPEGFTSATYNAIPMPI